ncbi:Glycosyl transferase family 11 [Nocardioides scoriae]|uniref:Glycosyl transferase family 11 n=1 Tax=Nocardioides scoriae TaxID=642780 RepID=A0A1H1WZ87_9ACTN|nr:alpha-1,2-fucosyltransferase [Nocardioides scoriae]SDT01726.1 Glycosyl transferase family 11 [Nocardioides scoriae]
MTHVRLMGGLGNQLFQLAAGLHLQQELGLPVRWDRSWFREPAAGDTHRHLELDGVVPRRQLSGGSRWAARLAWSGRNPRLLRERGPHHDLLASSEVDRHSWLEGYFQFGTYPVQVEATLAELLRPRLGGAAGQCGPDDVAVHVRLGDYHANPVTRRHHGLLEPDWFRRALGLVPDVGERRLVVFTDSPDVFEEEYAASLPGRHVVSPTQTAWDTLDEMSRCGTIVMSNSSLSWWAAFLARTRHPGGAEVLHPVPWFAEPGAADQHMPLDSWTAVPRD